MDENDNPGRRDRENAPAKTSRSRLWRATFIFFAGAIMLLWGAFLFWLVIKVIDWIAAIV
jgi:hypothetical protein